jgi:hypothetical protein
MGGAIRGLTAIVLLAASAWAADIRVLATTGIRVDGFGIAAIERPESAGVDVVFRGIRTSLEVAGRTFTSGDPLPAPLTGTFEEIVQGAAASGVGAFVAAANGSDMAWGLFLLEGANVTPLVSVGADEGVELRALTMNASGDVAYSAVASAGATLAVRPRATGQSTVIAPSNRSLRTLRGFTMDQAGAVAWMDSRGSVSHWDATHGLRIVDDRGRRPTRPKRSVALHPSYGLAYATRDAVQRWDPATGATTTLLERRAKVGTRRISRIYGDVGFLEDGTVTMRLSSSRILCLGAAPAFCDTPGKAGAGEATAPRRQGGVFRLDRRSTEAVVQPGDTLPGAGQLDDVVDHAVAGGEVAFVGTLSDQRDVLGRSRRGRLETLAVDGQQVGGRTLGLETIIYDARGAFVAVAASLLDSSGDTADRPLGVALVRKTGDVRPLLAPLGKRFVNATVDDVALAGNRAVVVTRYPDAFVSGRRRTKPVFVPSDGLRLDPISGVVTLAVTGSRVVFAAENAADVWGLYELDGRSPRRIAALPDWPTLFAADDDDVAFAVSPTEDGGLTYTPQLWIVSGGVRRELVRAGDPTPLGAILSIDALALTSDDVVFVATLSGDGARHALLAVSRR